MRHSDLTLKRLRSWHPEWEWTAERNGFGWNYVGRRAWSEVRLRAYAMVVGPADDDFATQWRAEEGDHSETFASWSMRNQAKTP